jgi:hypothetical protein
MDASVRESRAEALASIDVRECESSGGKVEGIGIFGIPACVQYYSDGGKICKDSSECEGYCYVPETLEKGMEAAGVCESSEHDSFGCFSRNEKGMVNNVICQD